MKTLIAVVLAFGSMSLANAQDRKMAESKSSKGEIVFEAKNLVASMDGSIVNVTEEVTVKIKDRLEIQSDSATYDVDKKMLVTYGTRHVVFAGTVSMKNENNKVCRYYLGLEVLEVE